MSPDIGPGAGQEQSPSTGASWLPPAEQTTPPTPADGSVARPDGGIVGWDVAAAPDARRPSSPPVGERTEVWKGGGQADAGVGGREADLPDSTWPRLPVAEPVAPASQEGSRVWGRVPGVVGAVWRRLAGWWLAGGWFAAVVSVVGGVWMVAGLEETAARPGVVMWWLVLGRPVVAASLAACLVLIAAWGAGPPPRSEAPVSRRVWRMRGLVVVAGLLVVMAVQFWVLFGDLGWASAAGVPGAPLPVPPPRETDLHQVITNLRNWIMGFLAAVATLFFTIGAVRYMGADGDPGEVDAAKRSFRNAGVGYALAVLAPLFLTALRSVVGG